MSYDYSWSLPMSRITQEGAPELTWVNRGLKRIQGASAPEYEPLMKYLTPAEKKIDRVLALLPDGVSMATTLHEVHDPDAQGQPDIVVKLSRNGEYLATFKEPADEFPSEVMISQIMLVV